MTHERTRPDIDDLIGDLSLGDKGRVALRRHLQEHGDSMTESEYATLAVAGFLVGGTLSLLAARSLPLFLLAGLVAGAATAEASLRRPAAGSGDEGDGAA